MRDALPLHDVVVDGFWMDATPVTNAEFERFVRDRLCDRCGTAADRRDYPGRAPRQVRGVEQRLESGGGQFVRTR